MTPETHPITRYAALEDALASDLAAACPCSHRDALGLEVAGTGSTRALTCRAVPHLMFNRVFHLGANAAEAIAAARARTPHRDVLVQLDPTTPPGVEAAITAAGLVPFRRDWIVLGRSPVGMPEASAPFEIERAARSDASAFAEIIAAGFDLPPILAPVLAALVDRPHWHIYVARRGPLAVAAGALFVHDRAAYLAMAATLPAHRGAGAHDALIARRARVARALGCDLLLVETGAPMGNEPNPSLDNLTTAGFTPLFRRRNFTPPGATWAGR